MRHRSFNAIHVYRILIIIGRAVWNNIKDTIIPLVEPFKQEVLRREKDQAIVARLHVLDSAIVKLKPRKRNDVSLRDIALYMPEVKDVLELPTAQAVTTADFAFLRTALPAFQEERKAAAREYLCELARKDCEVDADDPLALAVGSMFACDFCHAPYSWPHVFAHSCRARGWTPRDADHYVQLITSHTLPTTWAPSRYRVPAKALRTIIEAHGLSPATATVEEMDRSPVRMTCPRHNEASAVDVMNWRAMVSALLRIIPPVG